MPARASQRRDGTAVRAAGPRSRGRDPGGHQHTPDEVQHVVGHRVGDQHLVGEVARGEVAALAKSFEEDLIVFDVDTGVGDIHPERLAPDEAAYEALVLGTRDYIRKCGFRSVLVGLSGGIDSALVAAIGTEAVGKENVIGVGMPGPYSSEHSLTDARCLAHRLGIRLHPRLSLGELDVVGSATEDGGGELLHL